MEIGNVVLCKFYFSEKNEFKFRPILIFKMIAYDDFVGLPLSSKIDNLKSDEIIVTI
jgi:mRNA interferase MazF